MNLVGHVAVALRPDAALSPTTDFLVGCMLPDLAAIARVRLARPEGEIGRGVAFHHACDSAFHESEWFRSANCGLRDALVDVGVESGPARACSHAGVEMLLDGQLVTNPAVAHHARLVLETVGSRAPELGQLAPSAIRAQWIARLRMIGTSLEPRRYGDARFVAERLHRMTAGRRRIELRVEHVGLVAATLREFQATIASAAPAVVDGVRRAVPNPHRPE